MKKLLLSVAIAISMIFSSCEYDDTQIWDKLIDHENRISALEELCKEMNTNISSLQSIVKALQENDYVTSVTPVTKNGEVVGYTITFTKSEPITIYHGEDGKDGADGKDGYTPQIGVKKDSDNIYYWTIDGEWLLDANGNKIKAVGTDGKDGQNGSDGQDGANGKDGITPQLKIENDYWYISYDNGASWTQLGKATGEDGENGDSFFKSVTQDDNFVYFTLADGTVITLHKISANSANNKIYYTTTDGKKLFPTNTEPSAFGAILVSNVYKDGVGVLTFDDTITSIGDNAFQECSSLTSVTIGNSITSIGDYAFQSCSSLTSVYITDLSAWCKIAFSNYYSNPCYYGAKLYLNGSELTEVTIPSDITEIKNHAFYNCDSLTGVSIGNSVTSIGSYAFSSCSSLTSVTIPDRVTSIGSSAFYGCSSLTSVTIGSGVTSIGSYAFDECSSLTSVYCKPTTPPIGGSWMFNSNASGRKIYVPTASVSAYKAASYWSDYSSSIVGYDF